MKTLTLPVRELFRGDLILGMQPYPPESFQMLGKPRFVAECFADSKHPTFHRLFLRHPDIEISPRSETLCQIQRP